MNTALNELEDLSLGVMAQVLLHSQALPLQAWRTAEHINQALGTAARHAWVVRRWLAALTRAGLLHEEGKRLGWPVPLMTRKWVNCRACMPHWAFQTAWRACIPK